VSSQILNFSIAYGKTKHGLSRDWGVSLEEAGQTVEAWYSDRPEVKAWQLEQHKLVLKTGRVRCFAAPLLRGC
jgi:DNA polymerase-1